MKKNPPALIQKYFSRLNTNLLKVKFYYGDTHAKYISAQRYVDRVKTGYKLKNK